jgi:hypothetical protein
MAKIKLEDVEYYDEENEEDYSYSLDEAQLLDQDDSNMDGEEDSYIDMDQLAAYEVGCQLYL